jgi:hypothetical protein
MQYFPVQQIGFLKLVYRQLNILLLLEVEVEVLPLLEVEVLEDFLLVQI